MIAFLHPSTPWQVLDTTSSSTVQVVVRVVDTGSTAPIDAVLDETVSGRTFADRIQAVTSRWNDRDFRLDLRNIQRAAYRWFDVFRRPRRPSVLQLDGNALSARPAPRLIQFVRTACARRWKRRRWVQGLA